MGPIGCPEMSVRIYHYSLRNNPEERSSQENKPSGMASATCTEGEIKVSYHSLIGCRRTFYQILTFYDSNTRVVLDGNSNTRCKYPKFLIYITRLHFVAFLIL